MSMKVTTGFDPTDFGSTGVFSKQLSSGFDGTGYTNARLEYGIDLGDSTFDATGGTAEDQWTLTAHNMQTGAVIQFDAVGTGAEPFLVDTDYYVIRLTANTFQLATTHALAVAGTPIASVGDADSSGAWSTTLQAQYIGFTATQDTVINRLLVHIEDTTGFTNVKYGNTTALTNGIVVDVATSADVAITTLTDGIPVTNNGLWSMHCYDAQLVDWGSGNQMLAVRWTFGKSGKPLLLTKGEKFRVYLNDDMLALVAQYFTIQGYTQ